MASFFFDKDDFGLIILTRFVPSVGNVLGVGEVGPDIAEGGGEGDVEKVVPRSPRSREEEHPRHNAEVVQNLIPIAEADVARATTVTVHSVFQDDGQQIVAFDHWTVAVTLGDDVHDHGNDFQRQQSEDGEDQTRFEGGPPKVDCG